MKNLTYALAICALFSLISCGSDDDGLMVTQQQVIGTWDMQSLDYTGTSSTSTAGVSATTSFVGKAVDISYALTFNETPQTASAAGDYDIELTTTTEGITTTETVPAADDFVFDGTWTLAGNQLTVIDQSTTAVYEIKELTDNRMVLQLNTDVSETIFGITVSATLDGEVVLTR